MKSLLLLAAFAWSALAANPLIVSVGSSYAAGPGVKKTIGANLKASLEAYSGKTYDFNGLAVSGSLLNNITRYQAPKLKGLSPDLIFFLSGGNDLYYVSCLYNPAQSVCSNPEPQDVWQQDFEDALDAIFQNVANPTKVTVYVATYPVALGPATNCNKDNKACPLSSQTYVDQDTKLYNDQVDFTVAAYDDWKKKNSGKGFKTRIITMRQYSKGHEIGSQEPWVFGADVSNGAWHPNDAGTSKIANYIFSNFTG